MLRRQFLQRVTAACGLCVVTRPDKIIESLAELEDSNRIEPGPQILPASKIFVDPRLSRRVVWKDTNPYPIKMLVDSIKKNGQIHICLGFLDESKTSVVLVCGFMRMHAMKIISKHKDFDVWINVLEDKQYNIEYEMVKADYAKQIKSTRMYHGTKTLNIHSLSLSQG